MGTKAVLSVKLLPFLPQSQPASRNDAQSAPRPIADFKNAINDLTRRTIAVRTYAARTDC